MWVWPWQNKLQGTFHFCVWVYVCLTPKSHPKVSLFSPRAFWCNKILICPWLTLLLFCAEMQREWLVYPQYPWQMAALLCLWSGMGVAVYVWVWWRCRGQVSLTPLSRLCLQFVCAHLDANQLSSVSAPSQSHGPTTKNLFAVMFPFIALSVSSAPTVVSPHIKKNNNFTLAAWSRIVLKSFKVTELEFCCLPMTAPD